MNKRKAKKQRKKEIEPFEGLLIIVEKEMQKAFMEHRIWKAKKEKKSEQR